jgi:hypothetical protein
MLLFLNLKGNTLKSKLILEKPYLKSRFRIRDTEQGLKTRFWKHGCALVMDRMYFFRHPRMQMSMRMLCFEHLRMQMRIFNLTSGRMWIFYFHDVEQIISCCITDGTIFLEWNLL